jgi:hypothetical protein
MGIMFIKNNYHEEVTAMGFREKLGKLTKEQNMELLRMDSEAERAAFLAEHGISLTLQEKVDFAIFKKTGIKLLEDDELDLVAGGQERFSHHEKWPHEFTEAYYTAKYKGFLDAEKNLFDDFLTWIWHVEDIQDPEYVPEWAKRFL